MDNSSKLLMQRIIRRIPTHGLREALEKWDHLTAEQRRNLDVSQSKWALTQRLLELCEENRLTVKEITELEIIYVVENPNQGMWYTLQLLEPEDDAQSVDFLQFREDFKSHLTELLRHVSVKIKKHTDESIWIRIAWGSSFSKPNHLKPTYVVLYLQTSYLFVRALSAKLKPLLCQALTLSRRHRAIKDANLSGQKLTAIKDLLMKNYQQFPVRYPSPSIEKNQFSSNKSIKGEQREVAEHRQQMAGEAFGYGILPQLQSATYKLNTKFKDPNNKTMTERDDLFKCIVKFSSTNLLESLRHCASSGIASTPVTPLLSSIPLKGRNYFVITDNTPGPSQNQMKK